MSDRNLGRKGNHRRKRKFPGIKGARRPDKAYLRRSVRNGGSLQ